jgi:hypothetical protein
MRVGWEFTMAQPTKEPRFRNISLQEHLIEELPRAAIFGGKTTPKASQKEKQGDTRRSCGAGRVRGCLPPLPEPSQTPQQRHKQASRSLQALAMDIRAFFQKKSGGGTGGGAKPGASARSGSPCCYPRHMEP